MGFVNILVAGMALCFYAGLTNAGFKYGTCPEAQAVIPCTYDCQTNHGASVGTCTGDPDWNCVCSGPKNTSNTCTYFNPCTTIPLGCQCATNAIPILTGLYETICKNDCKCTHGGADGACDWASNQCICSYPTGFTWTKSTCPPIYQNTIYDGNAQIAFLMDLIGTGMIPINPLLC